MQALQELAADVYRKAQQTAQEPGAWDDWTDKYDMRAYEEQAVENEGDGLPDCDVCRNLRRVKLDVHVTDARFGQLLDCPRCAPYLERQRQYKRWEQLSPRLDQYGIIPRKDSTFDCFRIDERSESVRTAYQAARAFAQKSAAWLVLYGESGTGKTHLAMAVANEVRARHQTCLLATVPGWLTLLKSGFKDGSYEDLLNLSLRADYLILDDLGTQKETDWSYEQLFHVLNTRYNERKPLMVTMNMVPSVLDMRLSSRLMDRGLCKILHVVDSDYRPMKGAQ